MEARLASLEQNLANIRTDLNALREDVQRLTHKIEMELARPRLLEIDPFPVACIFMIIMMLLLAFVPHTPR